jgi:predicted ArsR family transcriptional regulator
VDPATQAVDGRVPEAGRDRVLGALRDAAGPLTVAAIGTGTGLSPNAVRFHLERLMGQGAVHAVQVPGARRPGRPAAHYVALPREAVDPASAYRVLAGLLTRELARNGGPDAAVEAGRGWAQRVLAWMADGSSVTVDDGPTDAMGLVMLLFTRTGFRPTLEDDHRTVTLHRCPFRELAVEQPEMVCGVHRGLVAGILDEIGSSAAVELFAVPDGSAPCVLRLTTSSEHESARELEQLP